jgi:hydrogenase nickel incorporation protein HypA/HybF
MHEMTLMASLLEILEEQARLEGFRQVKRVHLEIGRLSGVEPEAMRFAFDVATQGSVAEGADLVVLETAGRARCPACGGEGPAAAIYDPCPACGRFPQDIFQGREMRIVSLDVE